MIWLELFGVGEDGQPYRTERISHPFSTAAGAIAKRDEIARANTFSFGRVTGYRILDASGQILRVRAL